MFLKRRTLQAEYFDALDRPPEELAEAYAMLTRFNRLFLLSEPFKRVLPRLLGEERCRSLTLLDLGAGNNSLGNELSSWAARRGWNWRFTNLDVNPKAMLLSPTARCVAGSVLQLPFRDESFDVVIASQMAHHLQSDDDVSLHFKEAWRVTRDVVFLNDVHRNPVLYGVLWMLMRLQRTPEHFRSDALVSVRRGWRLEEWRRLAKQACLPDTRVWLYAGARIMLEARKRR